MKKLLTLTLVVLFVAVAVFAVPARPGFRVFEQPDGTKFIAQLKGDEHFHFAETEDRYAIIRNSEGWWTYANKVDGLLV
ncbi:MAG: Hemagluttinin repeat-containing protein, partial [candidate division TA06 bacterium 34_109]